MGKHDNFIKISYCIFKLHKPSIKFFYETKLCKGSEQFQYKEQFVHLHFNFMNPSKLTKGFKWYMEIKIIDLMSYFCSNNAII